MWIEKVQMYFPIFPPPIIEHLAFCEKNARCLLNIRSVEWVTHFDLYNAAHTCKPLLYCTGWIKVKVLQPTHMAHTSWMLIYFYSAYISLNTTFGQSSVFKIIENIVFSNYGFMINLDMKNSWVLIWWWLCHNTSYLQWNIQHNSLIICLL